MSTNIFPRIARDWINRLRGRPQRSATERIVERAANEGETDAGPANRSNAQLVRDEEDRNESDRRQ